MADDPVPSEHDDAGAAGSDRGRLIRWGIWLATVVGLALFAGFARVDTYLGVEAPRWDKRGEEYVWRVWWRASDDLISVSPSWLLDVALIGAAILFAALLALGLWLLLVSDREEAPPSQPVYGPRPETAGGEPLSA